MMTLGTIGAFGFEDFHPPEILSLYAAAGCRVVQAYRRRDRDITADEIRSVCTDLGLTIDSLHAHFGDDLDVSSEDESVRRASVAAYEPEAAFCRSLGGELLVLHPSPPRAPVTDPERRYAQLRRSFDELARLGERMGVRFAFENMPSYHPVGADVPRLVDEVAGFGSGRIVFLLDMGHAHMTCGIAEAVRAAGPHLRYTHVHDNDGVNDLHALPYRGTLPWDACGEALREVGYRGVFMLEVFEKADDLRRLLNEAWRDNIRAMLNHAPC